MASVLEAGLGEQMAGGRAGVDEGEGVALEVVERSNAAVLTGDNQAVVGAAGSLLVTATANASAPAIWLAST